MPKKYKVTLTSEERQRLEQMVRSGRAPARTLTRARVLLKADCGEGRAGWTDEQIGEALDVGRATVERVRQRFVEESFEMALYSRRPGRRYPHKLDGEAEAHLVALTCSSAPEGRARQTIRLLAGHLVELGMVESVSRETVRRVLKKELKPWLVKQWCIPPQGNAACVAAMEEVLEVYIRPSAPLCPLVCMDEKTVQLFGETQQPLPAKTGHEARYDFEHARLGVTNLFMFFEPLAGRRQVEVRPRRGARVGRGDAGVGRRALPAGGAGRGAR